MGRKTGILICLLLWPCLLLAQDPSQFEAVGNRDVFTVLDNTAAAADSLNVEKNVALKFRLDWSQVCFCLRVATRCYPTGTPARDSVLPFFRYFRATQDHSIDAWTAADTSSWLLYVRPAGARIK